MILVFKTTVDSKTKIELIKPHLDQISAIQQWNFDLWDCDKILRIDGAEDLSPIIIDTLNTHGFHCIEL